MNLCNDAQGEKTRCCPRGSGFLPGRQGGPSGAEALLAGSGVVFAGGMAHHFPPPLWRSALAFALPWDVGVVFNYFDEICHENTRRG